jgi:outer membrane immunogenic protein
MLLSTFCMFSGAVMKKLATYVIAAIALIGTPALAADLGRPVYKAPPPAPPAPVYSWTSWYVGLNAGGTWANHDSVDTMSTAVQGFGFPAPGAGTGPGSFAANSAAGATGSVSVGNDAGFIGGAQIGYNWQFSPAWVGGVEADIQGIGHGSNSGTLNTTVGPFTFGSVPVVINTQITSTRRVDWLGTVRGRLGYLWTPTVLVFGTGGLAYGGVKASTSITQTNNDCAATPECIAGSASPAGGSISQTRTGWTVGGGWEWMFSQHWSAKIEYLYYDLGSVTFSNGNLVTGSGVAPISGPAIVASQSSTHFNGNIVRVALNYQFY